MIDRGHALLKHHIFLTLVDRLVFSGRIETVDGAKFILTSVLGLFSMCSDFSNVIIVIIFILILSWQLSPRSLDRALIQDALSRLQVKLLFHIAASHHGAFSCSNIGLLFECSIGISLEGLITEACLLR